MQNYNQVSIKYTYVSEHNTVKCVEPKKRWVGGKFGWAVHRFPIKGGITKREIFRQELIESIYAAEKVMTDTLYGNLMNGQNAKN
jgi:hypothetical protein